MVPLLSKEISLRSSEKRRLLEILKRFKGTKVLVIGDFILDQYVWGDVERISPEAPVPVVAVKRESYMPGGSLNVANNIRSLGGIVFPCGVLGRDLEGRMLLKVIRREGIETGGVISDRNRPTSLKTRIIAHSQQVVRFDREKIENISKVDCQKMLGFIKQNIASVNAVIIEDYGKGVVQPELIEEVVRLARKHEVPVMVDPKEKHVAYYQGVSVITPNRKEAYQALEALAGNSREKKPDIDEVGKNLLKKLKCEAVLITLGEDGMALYEKNGTQTRIPTTAREVYDVSGAGDTVVAVFGLALAAGAKFKEAAMLANLAAGIVVGKLGTAVVSPEELQEIVEEN